MNENNFWRLAVLLILTLIIISGLVFFLVTGYKKRQLNNYLKESLELATDWFTRNQTEQGDFIYEINTLTGKPLETYNIVRQAGSLYSLAQSYKFTKNPATAQTLEKGFAFFTNYFVQPNPEQIQVVYKDSKQHNTSSLLLLALIEYMEADKKNKDKYLETAKNLGNFLLTTQKENGGFSYQPGSSEESSYNNGETFYALIRLYLLTGDSRYLESAQKASQYFEKEYLQQIDLSFYAWVVAGLAYLYKIEPKQEYWNFMKIYTDKYLDSSNKAKAPSGRLGFFLEGVTHNAWIAKEKDKQYFQKLDKYLKTSFYYLLGLQFNGPYSRRKTNFSNLSGAFCYNYYCQKVRIDLVHHNMSAIYLYLTKVNN